MLAVQEAIFGPLAIETDKYVALAMCTRGRELDFQTQKILRTVVHVGLPALRSLGSSIRELGCFRRLPHCSTFLSFHFGESFMYWS